METMQLTYRLCGVYMTFAGKDARLPSVLALIAFRYLLGPCSRLSRGAAEASGI